MSDESNEDLINQILDAESPYEVLGLEKNCSKIEIKKAYHSLSLKVHPDKLNHPKNVECFHRVSEAYHVLIDDEKRSKYDNGDESVWEDSTMRDSDILNPFEIYIINIYIFDLLVFRTFEDFISPKLLFYSLLNKYAFKKEYRLNGSDKLYRSKSKMMNKGGINDLQSRKKVCLLYIIPLLLTFILLFLISK